MPKKIAIITLVVIALAVVAGAAMFIAQQKQDKEAEKLRQVEEPVSTLPEKPEIDTSDWKLYRNEEYGFEFKYPSNWAVATPSEIYRQQGAVISIRSPKVLQLLKTEGLIAPDLIDDLLIFHLKGYKGIDDFILDKTAPVAPSKTKTAETLISGAKAIELSMCGKDCKYGIAIEKRSRIFLLSFNRTWDKSYLGEIEQKILSTFRFIESKGEMVKEVIETLRPKEIVPASVWDSEKCWPECIVKWHECENLDCISGIMEQYGASSEARDFTKLLPERGYLMQFQEKGKIDLGIVAFPDRANTNEEYYLLNGFPHLVSTAIKEEEVMARIKQDLLYSEMKEKYPNILFWGIAPQFVEKKVLSDKNERFIFTYRFVDECRTCDTEYSAKIGFDFAPDGKFLTIIFLQITKK